MGRQIIIGRNSAIWTAMQSCECIKALNCIAISHRQLDEFEFQNEDSVWVLSYSKVQTENTELLTNLSKKSVSHVYYVTSATTNVTEVTKCYSYPSAKRKAETDAKLLCDAVIISIGVVVERESDLPAGMTAATTYEELANFIASADKMERAESVRLFRPVKRPFRNSIEKALFFSYGKAQSLCGKHPCMLRPLDLALRICGMRWYGYVYLSNKLWFTTT